MKRFGPAMAIGLALAFAGDGFCQQMLQYGFEGRNPVWVPGPHDAAYKEILHRLSSDHIHSGQRSETIQIDAQNGTYVHYTYNLGRAPLTDDFNVSVWVRANRPGVQLLARVVFPKEFDPNNTGHPLTALLEGERYQIAQHWRPLTLPTPLKLLRQQQQLLSNTLKREINTTDAYVDQLVLNVYGGPGETQVWIDDLEAGPAFDTPSPTVAAETGWDKGGGSQTTPAQPALNHRPDEVRLEGGQLKVGNERLFMLGIRHTGTPLHALRQAGFTTVMLDESAPSGLIEQAANEGFWIVPTLHPPEIVEQPGGKVQGQLVANEVFNRNVGRFLREQAVLCWDLGPGNLPVEQCRGIMNTAQAIHNVDPLRPLAADVRDGFLAYSRAGNQQLMIGTHRWPLLTSMELAAYREWLMQRRKLLPADAYCWTWIQTHLPDWFMTTAYERTTGKFDEPIGPQPEQIRLLTYLALGCGYRGLGYWSDRFLADSHMGRDRLLGLALLNQELRMLEPLLVTVNSEPQWIPGLYPISIGPDQPNPNVMAAVLRCDKAVLVLPVWVGAGSQYVPPQGHVPVLKLKVPLVPENYTAWEVSPGRFRSYPSKPVLGGKEILIEDFSLTSAIVFTSDMVQRGSLVPRFQEIQRAMRKDAAQWTYDEAQEEIVKVARVHEELKKMGKKLNDGDQLLNTAREWLDKSRKHRINGEFTEAYTDAQLALRAVHILMREHWDAAVKRLTTPVACPFALSFYTLPRLWQYLDELAKLHPGKNVLPEGAFEWPPNQRQAGWGLEEIPSLDDVEGEAKRVANDPREGKQCLMLKLQAKDAQKAPKVLERTFMAIHSPSVHLPPGTPVRISAWVRVPGALNGSPDGALLYDSAGGEPLAVRISLPTAWRQFILYRTVPASGTIHVSMALTALGSVYFDDVRIEPMAEKSASEVAATSATLPAQPLPRPSGSSWTGKLSTLLPWSKPDPEKIFIRPQ
jgi:hypothetical protein